MKFEGEDADDRMIAAAICTKGDDILLATRTGRCIRFPVEDVRVFTGRTSVGVRGIRLTGQDDALVSLSVLRHVEVTTEQRYAYLRLASERRRGASEEPVEADEADGENGDAAPTATLSEEQYAELAAREEFVLTITEKGFGKRTSAYDYPVTGRGGQGRDDIAIERGQGPTIAVFPVAELDQIMLVSDAGMVIRVPVAGISLRRRRSGGVTVIKVEDGERVVSAARFPEAGENGEDGSTGEAEP
jgi:DNA gyrase subunit A